MVPTIVRVETGTLDRIALFELLLAAGLVVVVWLLLRRSGLLGDFARAWGRNPLLLLFCGYALMSVAWSVSIQASLYKWAMLGLATLVGSYLGFRLSLPGLLKVFRSYAAVVFILSAAIAILLPVAGRMMFHPYDGAWRGIFWHRNHLGILAALFTLFLLYRLEQDWRSRRRSLVGDGLVYLLGLLLVGLSRSATGYIVLLVGHVLFVVAYAWFRLRSRLRARHYVASIALAVAALGLLAANLNVFLGLFGRNSSLTGRIPMWNHVLAKFVSQRPILGYGMGAFWNVEAVRVGVQKTLGWGSAVQIGDNGWVDVLLNLGLVGLVLFCLVLLTMFWRALGLLRRSQEFEFTLPMVFFLMVLLANVTFSLFFEIESGVWLMLASFLFLNPSPAGAPQASAVPPPRSTESAAA